MSNEKSVSTKFITAVSSLGSIASPSTRLAYAPAYQIAILSFVFGFMIGVPSFMLFVPKTEVKGVQPTTTVAHALPIISPTDAPRPTTTLTPAPTKKPALKTGTATIKKEYGGWYWRPELERAQRWVGTDSQGNDIWSDGE